MPKTNFLGTHLDVVLILFVYIYLFGMSEEALQKLFMNLQAIFVAKFITVSPKWKRIISGFTSILFILNWFDLVPSVYYLLNALLRFHLAYYLVERKLRTGDVLLVCMELSEALKRNSVIEKQIYASFVPYLLSNVLQIRQTNITLDFSLILPNVFLLSDLISRGFGHYIK